MDMLGKPSRDNTCGFVTTTAYEKLRAENAKLRELLHDAAIELYVNGNVTDGATELLFDQMRELGIEVG